MKDRALAIGLAASGHKLFSAARRALPALYWAAVAGLFVYAAFLRFRLPLEPMFDRDTYDYLSPAVAKLIGWGFIRYRRNYFYPGFLLSILSAFADLRAIVVVQHFLGLAAGAIFLLVWKRIRSFMPAPGWPQYPYHFLGLIPAAIYLTADEPIRFETNVRPEGITSFLVVLSIFFILEFSYRCYVSGAREIPVTLGLGSVISSIFVTLAKPSLALAAAGALVPVVAMLFCSYSRKSKVALAVSSLIVAMLLILPARLPARYDSESVRFLPRDYFMVHANLMREQIGSDLSGSEATKYPRDFLVKVHQILGNEINKSPTKGYPVLGFDPNSLMYSGKSAPLCADRQILAEFEGRIDDVTAFYRYYYARVWLKRPDLMLSKIGHQMRLFYLPICRAYWLEDARPLGSEYSLTAIQLPRLRQVLPGYEPLARPQLMSRTTELAKSGLRLPVPRFLWYSQSVLAHTYTPTVAVVAVVLVVVVVYRPLRRRMVALAAVTAFLFCYNLAACFEVALLHSIDNTRYNTIQLIFTVLAQFTAFLLIAQFAFEIRRSASRLTCPDNDGGMANRRSRE